MDGDLWEPPGERPSLSARAKSGGIALTGPGECCAWTILAPVTGYRSRKRRTHLLPRSSEVNLCKLEDKEILTVSADFCGVAKRRVVVALRLVERHVVRVNAAYHQAVSEVRRYTSWVAVAGILDTVAVGVPPATTIDRENQIVRGGRFNDKKSRRQRDTK